MNCDQLKASMGKGLTDAEALEPMENRKERRKMRKRNRNPYAILERTIYIADKNMELPLLRALTVMTDDWIIAGNASQKTVLDLRDALIAALEKV